MGNFESSDKSFFSAAFDAVSTLASETCKTRKLSGEREIQASRMVSTSVPFYKKTRLFTCH